MQFLNVRDFKINSTKYLRKRKELVITRRGEPIAVLFPVEKKSMQGALLRIGQIFNEAKISKEEVLRTLGQVREEIYEKSGD